MPEHTPAPTPSRAVYGFAMYLSFKSFFVLFLIWAIIPEQWFRYIGITCLPQRYWAVAIPVFLLTTLAVFAFIIYPSLGLLMTPSIDDLRTIRDSVSERFEDNLKLQNNFSKVGDCCCVDKSKCKRVEFERISKDFNCRSIPALRDLKIWEVSESLYSK